MTRRKPLPILVITVTTALALLAGCAATPEDRWYQQRDALNTANRLYLAQVPELSDEQVVTYGQLLQTARMQLYEARTQLPGGGQDFNTLLDLVEATLERFAELEREGDSP